MLRKITLWLFIVCMIIMNAMPVLAAEPDLIITGSGVDKEVIISSGDWSKYNLIERTYSTNNSLGFHKIVKAKGYDLFDLMDGLKTDKDYSVKFTCSDGFEFTKTISELKNAYYFSDFTESSKKAAMPMIAKYTKVIADFPKNLFAPPHSWTDIATTEADLDKDFPKLVFGQTNIDDMNMSKWGKEVVKITVGVELVKTDKDILFADIKDHWAKDSIMEMAARGYAKGSNGLFRPKDNISRAEFVSLMVRALNLSGEGRYDFTDVKAGDWFAKDVFLAAEKGYVKGYEDGTFKPNSPITRQEIGSIIGSMLEDEVTNVDEVLSIFNDQVAQWAKVPVAKSVKAEIIKGLPGNIFGGTQNTSRAEATVMLLRYLNK